jgi:hypothetical protein
MWRKRRTRCIRVGAGAAFVIWTVPSLVVDTTTGAADVAEEPEVAAFVAPLVRVEDGKAVVAPEAARRRVAELVVDCVGFIVVPVVAVVAGRPVDMVPTGTVIPPLDIVLAVCIAGDWLDAPVIAGVPTLLLAGCATVPFGVADVDVPFGAAEVEPVVETLLPGCETVPTLTLEAIPGLRTTPLVPLDVEPTPVATLEAVVPAPAVVIPGTAAEAPMVAGATTPCDPTAVVPPAPTVEVPRALVPAVLIAPVEPRVLIAPVVPAVLSAVVPAVLIAPVAPVALIAAVPAVLSAPAVLARPVAPAAPVPAMPVLRPPPFPYEPFRLPAVVVFASGRFTCDGTTTAETPFGSVVGSDSPRTRPR